MRRKGDDFLNKLMNDPEVWKLVSEKIATMGLTKEDI